MTVSPFLKVNIFLSKDLYIFAGVAVEESLMEVQQVTGIFLHVAVKWESDMFLENEMNKLESKEWIMEGAFEPQNSPKLTSPTDAPE